MGFFAHIEIISESHFGPNKFNLAIRCREGDAITEHALEYLKDFITNEFRSIGLDIGIIPEDLYDFEDWVMHNSDSFVSYITSFAETFARELPTDIILNGWWDIYGGEIDKESENIIEGIIEESMTLEELVDGLKDAFGYNNVECLYNPSYENTDYYAELIVRDLIRDLK